MKREKAEPLATFMAFTTLVIIGGAAKHCMKKYTGGGRRRGLKLLSRR